MFVRGCLQITFLATHSNAPQLRNSVLLDEAYHGIDCSTKVGLVNELYREAHIGNDRSIRHMEACRSHWPWYRAYLKCRCTQSRRIVPVVQLCMLLDPQRRGLDSTSHSRVTAKGTESPKGLELSVMLRSWVRLTFDRHLHGYLLACLGEESSIDVMLAQGPPPAVVCPAPVHLGPKGLPTTPSTCHLSCSSIPCD